MCDISGRRRRESMCVDTTIVGASGKERDARVAVYVLPLKTRTQAEAAVRIPSTHPHRHSSSPSSCPSSSTRPPPSPVCTYPPPHSHPRRRCPVHAACPQLGTIGEGMSRGLVSAVWSCNKRGWIARGQKNWSARAKNVGGLHADAFCSRLLPCPLV